MSEEEIAESIKTKLQAVLKDPSALNRRKACDLICEAIHAITLLQFCLRTSKEQFRKETAKEILRELISWNDEKVDTADFVEAMSREYGIEVGK